jgi:transcription initiation factor TFIID subunit 2
MEAAYSLARGFAGTPNEETAFRHLKLAFRKKFSIQTEQDVPLTDLVPRRNDFSAFTEYFVQKAIVAAFALFKDTDLGSSPTAQEDCKRFIIAQLQLNDNSSNAYWDHHYISALLSSLGAAFIPVGRHRQQHTSLLLQSASVQQQQQQQQDASQPKATENVDLSYAESNDQLFADAIREVERHLFLETQLSSPQRTIAKTCLEVLHAWMLAGLMRIRLKPFLFFARYGNHRSVRRVCIEALIVLAAHDEHVGEFLVQLLHCDAEHSIRVYVAERLTSWMLTLNSMKVRYERQTLPETERRDAGVAAAAAAFRQFFSSYRWGGAGEDLPRKVVKVLAAEIDKIRDALLCNQRLKESVWELLTYVGCLCVFVEFK